MRGCGRIGASFQALDRDEGGQRLALALDDEFIVPEGDAIQHVADALPDGDGGYSFCHGLTPLQLL